ncbi:MAG: hypothetical protein H6868_00275 [Rhodospirillales bacterium]|nr:hypothetical protein [Rhodospirillales bacterium]
MTANINRSWKTAAVLAASTTGLLGGCVTNGPLPGGSSAQYNTVVNGGQPVVINVESDHRGVLYYKDKQGRSTQEPVRLSDKTCGGTGAGNMGVWDYAAGAGAGYVVGSLLDAKRTAFAIAGAVTVYAIDYFQGKSAGGDSMKELQCMERGRWEAEHGYNSAQSRPYNGNNSQQNTGSPYYQSPRSRKSWVCDTPLAPIATRNRCFDR